MNWMNHHPFAAEMTREASLRTSHWIHTTPSPPPSHTHEFAPCHTTPSQHVNQLPFYPNAMEQDRQDATLLLATLVQGDAYMARDLGSNSNRSHDVWNMPHESYQDATAHPYTELQARKRQENSLSSMQFLPTAMSPHGSVPMGHHARTPMPHLLPPTCQPHASMERHMLYPCPPTVVRFPFTEQTLGDVWPVLGPSSVPIIGTRQTVQSLPALLASQADDCIMSPHQVFLRLQIEVFAASIIDTSTHMRGRNKAIQLHQVGIRCRFCAHVPLSQRQKGHAYYPATLLALYQAAQNMSTNHLQCGLCKHMPDAVKQRFADLIPSKNTSSGCGRTYWAETARNELGLIDTDDGIFVGCDQTDL